MAYWKDIEGKGSWATVLLAGVVAGAVVVGLAWWGTWWWSPDDPAGADRAVVHSGHATEGLALETTGASEATSELALCQSVYDEQGAPLRAAADSLGQWEVHVGAMNKLVTGEITLDQATQFWNRTRVGAHAKLHAFATARGDYARRIFRCPSPHQEAGAKTELDTCHHAVTARGRVLRLATLALVRWEEHVHHMDMLRSGEMTPEQATELWLQNWRAGDREIRAYQAAARTAKGLRC